MKNMIRHLVWLMKGVKVFALVGKSGTGKSFRAKLLTQKYGIELIIDDGILIKDNKILAGRSAKKEQTYLGAIKTALFHETKHRKSVLKKLQKEKFKRILLIGTSVDMVHKIAQRLALPSPDKIIKIEDIATKEEIEEASRSRKIEGKHVIPVPGVEIQKRYSQIFYDSIKVFFKKKMPIFGKDETYEKAIVRPEFSKGRIEISEAALYQMLLHCIDEYNPAIKVARVSIKPEKMSFRMDVYIEIPLSGGIAGELHSLQEYIINSIEKYAGVSLERLNIIIEKILDNHSYTMSD